MNPFEPRRIAMVEDNDEDHEVFVAIVRATGLPCNVRRFSTGEQACEAYVGGQEDLPDLLFLDLNLFGMDGMDLLRNLRASPRARRLPVLAFTTSDNPRDVELLYELGANAYYIKPVDLDALERLVGAILRLWLQWTILPDPQRNRKKQ